MKKMLIQTLVIASALAFAGTTFAQSPTATRQRRTSSEDTQSDRDCAAFADA